MKRKIIILFLIFLFIYSVFLEPNNIKVEKLHLSKETMPELNIVFVSDFHLSPLSGGRLKRIVKKINELNPDIVILGGDYYIMHRAKFSMKADKIAQELAKIETKYGIYSVLGNHDTFKDGKEIKTALTDHGIKVLENSNQKLKINNKEFYIAGISDMQTTLFDLDKALYHTKRPTILVSHTPDITPLAKDKVDLILSGHTHGGQARIPFIGPLFVPSKYGKRYASGFVENIVYTTRGLGTTFLRVRFNCPPEITLVRFN